MSKMVRLKCHWSNAKGTVRLEPGNVVGLRDAEADALVAAGKAEYAPEGTRALRYAPTAPVQTSCFAPDAEAQEKDAVAESAQTKTSFKPPFVGKK